jgi:hypothetical protein
MKTSSFRQAVSAVLLLACALAPAAQAQALRDNPKCSENPLFSRFAGERLAVCERMRFASLELWRWKRPGDPKSGTEPTNVEGETWNYLSEIERDAQGRHPSTLEIKRNFENAVLAAGGTVIGADGSTVSYRIVRADGEYWGRSGCGRGGDDCAALMHRIVRKAALAQQVGVLGGAGGAAPPAQGGTAFVPQGRPNQTSAAEVGVLPDSTGLDRPAVLPERPTIIDPRRPMIYLVEMKRPPEESFAHGWIDILDARVGPYERQTKKDAAGNLSMLTTTEATVLIRARAADGSDRFCSFPVCSLTEAVALASLVTQPYATVHCTTASSGPRRSLGRYSFHFTDHVYRDGGR